MRRERIEADDWEVGMEVTILRPVVKEIPAPSCENEDNTFSFKKPESYQDRQGMGSVFRVLHVELPHVVLQEIFANVVANPKPQMWNISDNYHFVRVSPEMVKALGITEKEIAENIRVAQQMSIPSGECFSISLPPQA